jgi:GrpB-like predicted nucleotidyltransferase (UPF0157 family)
MSGARAVVVAYDAAWPERAGRLVATLETALGGRVDRIDHIGSTAIPGMAAKDVLDLQVSATDLEGAGGTLEGPLAGLGFECSPHRRDHVPAGRTDDPALWAKLLWWRRGHPDGDVHLHVRRTGSPNERMALLFRDWFRAHPDSVPAYGAFKLALARATADIDTYTDVKDPVVDLVASAAERWARTVDWHP